MKKVEAADSPTRKSPLVRGKYTNLLRQGTNVAILDADVADHFPDSESVNNALRAFLAFGKQFESVVSPRHRPRKRIAEQGHELVFDPRTGGNHKVLAAK